MSDFISGGVAGYLLDIIGIDFDGLSSLTPSQVILVVFACAVAVYVLLFIVRGVLGGTLHMFR